MKRTLTHSLTLTQRESPCFFESAIKCGEMKGLRGGNKRVTREVYFFSFCFLFFPPPTAQSFKNRREVTVAASEVDAEIRRLRLNLLHLLLPGTHSEFTSGRCFHIERGARPRWGRSQHIGNRHILLTASGGKDRIGLCSTEGTGD